MIEVNWYPKPITTVTELTWLKGGREKADLVEHILELEGGGGLYYPISLIIHVFRILNLHRSGPWRSGLQIDF